MVSSFQDGSMELEISGRLGTLGTDFRESTTHPDTACKFISSWAYMHSQGKDIIKLIGFSYLRSSQAHWIGQRAEKTYLQMLFHLV